MGYHLIYNLYRRALIQSIRTRNSLPALVGVIVLMLLSYLTWLPLTARASDTLQITGYLSRLF